MKKSMEEEKVPPVESMNPPVRDQYPPPQQDASPQQPVSNKKRSNKGNKKKTRKNSGHESFSQSNLVEMSDLGDIKDDAVQESGLNIPSNIQ